MQYLLNEDDNMIKAVVFDLDDTLYKERDFVYSGFMEVAKYLGKKFSLNADNIYKLILDIFHEKGRGKVFNILCDKYSLDESVDKLVEIYRNNIPDIKLYDDAIYILERLKDTYSLGIITDGKNTVQWNKIKALDVEKYIDKIIVTDDYGKEYWKPSKEPYKDLIKHFNVEPEECIYVGDNPNKDFISANRLGIYTVRIIRQVGDHMDTTMSNEYEADYRIRSLVELEDIIDILNEKR